MSALTPWGVDDVVVAQATQAGGVTYYSCPEQDVGVAGPGGAPRAQRRRTAAIPIVRPHHAHLPQDRSQSFPYIFLNYNLMFKKNPIPSFGQIVA